MNLIHLMKLDAYVTALHALKEDDRLRGLKPRTGIDFASNDYLALASAPRMKKALLAALEAGTPIGAGGSRLLRGNARSTKVSKQKLSVFWSKNGTLLWRRLCRKFRTHRQMRKRGWQSPSGSQIVPYSLATMRAQCGLPLHCRLAASISAESGRQRCQLARLVYEFH